jgi:hypothetical protein
MTLECFLDDDGGSVVIAVEADDNPTGHRQALWVRVGEVFDGDQVRDEPGVWVEYQERYLASGTSGPVLLTPAIWRKLARAVCERLEERNCHDAGNTG